MTPNNASVRVRVQVRARHRPAFFGRLDDVRDGVDFLGDGLRKGLARILVVVRHVNAEIAYDRLQYGCKISCLPRTVGVSPLVNSMSLCSFARVMSCLQHM